MARISSSNLPAGPLPGETACTYHVLRYTPNLVRDEWVNIGILLFNSATGERRMRLIEEEEEYRRVRRLHPQADEAVLRALRDDLEERFQSAETLRAYQFPPSCLPAGTASDGGFVEHLEMTRRP
jgi:hypothetical protein